MSFPSNIEKEHLLKAIQKIDLVGVTSDEDSNYYDVRYSDKFYPPKLVVSYANIFANVTELDRKTFEGGLGTPCFKLFERTRFCKFCGGIVLEIKKYLN